MEINKYNSSKIYKIVDKNYTKTYFGSTTQKLSQRMALHRSCYKKGINQTSAKIIFDEFGIDNCKIELVEEVNCSNKDQLTKIEGKYIKENVCVNKVIPKQTNKEWRDKNKEKLSAYKKEYNKNEETREHNREYIKNYYHKNKEKFMKCKYYGGKIFKIYSEDTTRFYIGATFDKLEDRFEFLMKKSKISKIPALCCLDVLSKNWKIELIVEGNFKNNDELYQLESLWIKANDKECLNYANKYEDVDVSEYLDGRFDDSLLPEVFKGQKKV
jgi:adenylate kinase family enzyme